MKEIKIVGYRGIKKINVNLNRINILVGPNNTGKSAILESVALLSLKNQGFVDAKGTNLINHLLRKKRYELEFLVNISCRESEISSGNEFIKILYLERGFPNGVFGFEIHFLEEKIKELISKDLNLEYRNAIERAIKIFADEMNLENFENFQRAKSSTMRKLTSLYSKNFVDEILKLIYRIPKLIFYTPEHTYMYLPHLPPVGKLQKVHYYNLTGLVHLSPKALEKSKRTALSLQYEDYHQSIRTLYDELVKKGKINSTIKMLKELLPFLIDIRKTGKGQFFVLTGYTSKSIPITSMGDGFISLIRTAFTIGFVENGLVLLEEPEVFLHPGYGEIISRLIVSNSKTNQFIISTHSIDFLESVLEAANEMEYLDKVNVIRLHRRMDTKEIYPEVLKGDEALDEIKAIGTDLRIT